MWAHLGAGRGHEQSGHRPVLVLSKTSFNRRSNTVIATILTSQKPSVGYPLALEVDSSKLPKRSWIRIHQVQTLSVYRLGRKITSVSPEELASVVRGLNEIIGR